MKSFKHRSINRIGVSRVRQTLYNQKQTRYRQMLFRSIAKQEQEETMTPEEPKVIRAFGKYLTEIDGEIETFEDESEARTAAALAQHSEEINDRVNDYCLARKLTGRKLVSYRRVIKDFLAYEASL